MEDRRGFVKGVAGVAATVLAASLPYPVSRQASAAAGEGRARTWTSQKIREDASETMQAFLRRDPGIGSAVLVSFPPGWRTQQLVCYKSDEAVFVLDGDFGIGGHTLTTGHYCYLPYQMVRKDIYSRNGNLVLAFFSHISKHYDVPASRAAEANQGLEVVDPRERAWQILPLPEKAGFAGTVLVKPLRETGINRTYLVMLAPGFSFAGEQHCQEWQEWFLLSGNVLVGREICQPGAYRYMPVGARFGPICSETGALVLARFAATSTIEPKPSEAAQGVVDSYRAATQYVVRPHPGAR